MPEAVGAIVTALFRDVETAQRAARELDANGVDRERVRVTAASQVVGPGGGLTGWLRGAGGSANIALVAEVPGRLVHEAIEILRRRGAERVERRGGERREAHARPQVTEQVVERPVTVRDEVVQVERRPVSRPATAEDQEERGGASDEMVLPVLEERLDVEKTRRETARVRVRKSVESGEQTVHETHVEQSYDVERVPVNREVAEAPEPRYEGDTLVLPVLEEVVVVEKRLMLREEVRITRRREERSTPRTLTVRRERVEVERGQPEA